jgi:hypothetical protein
MPSGVPSRTTGKSQGRGAYILVWLVDLPDHENNGMRDQAFFEELLFSTDEILTGRMLD